MRLLRKCVGSNGKVEVKVSVSTSEDLWHLYNIVVCGDHVRTKTKRKVAKETSISVQTAEVRVVTLELRVQKVDFSPDELRIYGVNASKNEYVNLGAHHTLSISTFPPQDVTIIKEEWDNITEARLKEACDNESRADTAAVIMNYGTARVLLITPSFMFNKASIEQTIAKKHKNDGKARDKSIQRFFKHVLDAICLHVDFEKIKVLLLCSPANTREEFLSFMKEATSHAEMGELRAIHKNMSKVILIKVTDCTNDALNRALADPLVANKFESTRCSDDIRVWGTFQSTMNSVPDRCVYTSQIVYKAVVMGAVERLMLSDAVFRSEHPIERRFYLALVNLVKNGGGKVNIFSSSHVTGKQLEQLGSVAAILLFACPELDEVEVVEDFINGVEVADFVRENAPKSVTV